MVRLIVTDGGTPRAFKVGAGLLRVGGGEDMKLRLTSKGVAAHHADLQIGEDHVLLMPVETERPPTVDGAPATGRVRVEPGSTITLGAATIAIEGDEAAAAPSAAKPVVRARSGGTLAARTRRKERQATSPAKILGLTILGFGVLGTAFWFLFSMAQSSDPVSLLKAAELHIEARNNSRAGEALARMPGVSELSPDQVSRLRAAEAGLAALRAESSSAASNVEGYKFFEVKLERYRNEHLGDEMRSDRARFFLLRCQEFRERWPHHPELTWVDAEEKRLKPLASLDRAPRLGELEWVVKNLTGGSPRRYRKAFEEIDFFLKEALPGDRPPVDAMRAELETARAEYFEEKRDEAQEAYERDNISGAVGWLIELIVNIGDKEFEDRAATTLIKIPGVDGYLRKLRTDDPIRWGQLVRNAKMQSFATKAGLL